MASITFSKVHNWREVQRPPPRTDPPPTFGIFHRNSKTAKKRVRTEEGEEKKVKVKPESTPLAAPPSPPSRLPPSYKPEDEPTRIPKEAGAEGAAFIHAPSFDYSAVTPEFVLDLVRNRGIPVVLRNVLSAWNYSRENFSFEWLKANDGATQIVPRDNILIADVEKMSLAEYLNLVGDGREAQRARGLLYGKDLPAPSAWRNLVLDKLPGPLHWLRNGDLLGDIPAENRPESVMTYIGYEGTRTPGHLDLCSTIGHNIMLYANDNSGATWYIAARKDLPQVEKLWEEHGHSIHDDNFFMPYECLKTAPFRFFVVDQHEGDCVLIPPDSAHQVINYGESIKLAWNRVSVYLVQDIVSRTLPMHSRYKKAQTYRIKYSVYCAIQERCRQVLAALPKAPPRISELLAELPTLLNVYEDILREEWIPTYLPPREMAEMDADDRRTCDICNGDIFNRFFAIRGTTDKVLEQLREREDRPTAMAMTRAPVEPEPKEAVQSLDVCLHCAPSVSKILRKFRAYDEGAKALLICTFRWRQLMEVLHTGYEAYAKLLELTHLPPVAPIPSRKELVSRIQVASGDTIASRAYVEIANFKCHSCSKVVAGKFPCSKCTRLTCDACRREYVRVGDTSCAVCENTCKCTRCRCRSSSGSLPVTERQLVLSTEN